MCQETQQCTNKGSESEDWKLVNMDVNSEGLKKEICLLELRDSHNKQTCVTNKTCGSEFTKKQEME